jgi:hypothetical protein
MKMIIPGTKLKNNLIYVGVMLDEKGGHYHLLAKDKDEEGLFTWHEANKDRGLFVYPTSKELNLMRTISEALGMAEWYWASTEYNSTDAWIQRFSDGYQNYVFKYNIYRLRCVRRVDSLTLQSLIKGGHKKEKGMTRNKVASQIAKLEGRKSQASIGDIREVLKLLCALEASYRVKAAIKDGVDTDDAGPQEVFAALEKDTAAMAQKAALKYFKGKKK